MHPVIVFDPAVGSTNLGDQIIAAHARRHLVELVIGHFVVTMPTHSPQAPWMNRRAWAGPGKFVLGSNLLRGRMNRPFRQWDVTAIDAVWLRHVTLMGVGWWKDGDEPNAYTRTLYRALLNGGGPHAVRDSFTADRLRACGVTDVVNTSCPTLWNLTPEHCRAIPSAASDTVVTTVTDYARDAHRDARMLMALSGTYRRVLLWPQGLGDLTYLRSLGPCTDAVEILPPTVDALHAVLRTECEYVGTRLHAGAEALNFGRRSLVVSVDNRAREISADTGLPTIGRSRIEDLPDMLRDGWTTQIALPHSTITRWKRAHAARLGARGALTTGREGSRSDAMGAIG